MLTVHHLGRSQSERIVWLCEELELPYELKRYDREPSGAAPPAYKALHPFGTAPVITDEDFTMGESGAIIEYISRKHAGGKLLLGPEHPDFADFLYWYHFANGTMVAGAMMDFVAKRLGVPPVSNRSDRCFELVEDRLGKAAYFAGQDFTAADIMMGYPLTSVSTLLERDLAACPNTSAYLKRIRKRPAYQRARAKAEPDLPA